MGKQAKVTRLNIQWLLHKLHLYIGLWLGMLVLVVSATGALLVYTYPLDRLLNPTLLRVIPTQQAAPIEDIVAAARAHDEHLTSPTRIQISPRPDMPYILSLMDVRDDAWIEVMVDPGNARVLGSRRVDDALIWQVFHLHTELLAGETGFILVAITGVALLIAAGTGLYLWWPRRGQWKNALRFKPSRSTRKTIYDLHRIGGAYFAVIILMLSFTGVYIMYPDIVGAPVKALSGDTASRQMPPGQCAGPITLDGAVARARTLFPQAKLTTVYPGNNGEPHRIAFRQSGEWRYFFGSTSVSVTPDCGHVVAVDDALAADADTAIGNALLPWHSGQAFGHAGRILVLLTGIATAALTIAGVLVWWQKRRYRRPGG